MMTRRDFLSTATIPAILPLSTPIPDRRPTAYLSVNGSPYRVVFYAIPPADLPAGSIGCLCDGGMGVMVFEPDPTPEGRAGR